MSLHRKLWIILDFMLSVNADYHWSSFLWKFPLNLLCNQFLFKNKYRLHPAHARLRPPIHPHAIDIVSESNKVINVIWYLCASVFMWNLLPLLRYTTFFLSMLWQKKGLNNMNGNQPQRGTDSRRCVVASSISCGESSRKRIKMINFILIKGPANRNLMGINYSKLWHNPLKMNQNFPISDLYGAWKFMLINWMRL